MDTGNRFRVNEPNVVHETIDGEVVIINLDSGTYYSLNKAGADVWEGIAAGAGLDDLFRMVSERYDGDSAAITESVRSLLAELQGEQLIVPDANAGRAAFPLTGGKRPKAPFEPCALQKFTDMTELLLLDPVHDVDEPGWPIRKPAGTTG